MTENTDDRRAKIYALQLLNRLDRGFDVREVSAVAEVLTLVEADVADWLAKEMQGSISRTLTIAGIRAGKHRPPYELKGDNGETLSRHNGDGSLIEAGERA